MKKLLLGSVGLVLFWVPAFASDIYRAPVPADGWTGFYGGLNAGGSWNTSGGVNASSSGTTTGDFFFGAAPSFSTLIAHTIASTNAAAVPDTFKTGSSGFLGGGQIGYNWQFGQQWVAGFETDIQRTDLRGTDTRQGAATGFFSAPRSCR